MALSQPLLMKGRLWRVAFAGALALFCGFLPSASRAADETGVGGKKPHLVFVAGTHHYHPEISMPVLAGEMERFGFRTTVILPDGDPEMNKNGVGLSGLEALADADVAVFFMRFLTLDDAQFALIEEYLKSGKPVVAFRTSTHAFNYPEGHERFHWNDDFGIRVCGTPYLAHMRSDTQCETIEAAREHPVLTGVGTEPFVSGGVLYLTGLEPGVVPLVLGSGSVPEAKIHSNQFGVRYLQENEKDIVAWTWDRNYYGARVFGTSFGHLTDFGTPQTMRLLVNGIHWAAGQPVPDPDAEVKVYSLEEPAEPPKKKGSGPK